MDKRIAIFNGFPFHYEMFGCIFEFLKNNSLTFSVYSETTNEMGWFSVYESLFGSMVINPINMFCPDKYDYVFLLTDDDFKYKWNTPKIIQFEHHGPRYVPRTAHRRIPVRFFQFRMSPPHLWAFPVWTIFQKPKTSVMVHIVAIGNNCPSTPDELCPWFDDITQYRFTFINREPAQTSFNREAWKEYPNVTLLTNIDARTMLETAASADWCLLLPKNAHQKHNSISAILPIAYGVGTPILMHADWVAAYNLGGLRSLDASKPIEKPTEAILNELQDTVLTLKKRRDSILEECLH